MNTILEDPFQRALVLLDAVATVSLLMALANLVLGKMHERARTAGWARALRSKYPHLCLILLATAVLHFTWMVNLLTLWGVAVDWHCSLDVNFHTSDTPIGTLGPTGTLILDGAAALLLLLPLHHFWIAEKPFSQGFGRALKSGNFWCGAAVLYTVLLHCAWVLHITQVWCWADHRGCVL